MKSLINVDFKENMSIINYNGNDYKLISNEDTYEEKREIEKNSHKHGEPCTDYRFFSFSFKPDTGLRFEYDAFRPYGVGEWIKDKGNYVFCTNHSSDNPVWVLKAIPKEPEFEPEFELGTLKYDILKGKICKIVDVIDVYENNEIQILLEEQSNNKKYLARKSSLRELNDCDWIKDVNGISYEAFEDHKLSNSSNSESLIIIYRNGIRLCAPVGGELEHDNKFRKDFCKLAEIPIKPLNH